MQWKSTNKFTKQQKSEKEEEITEARKSNLGYNNKKQERNTKENKNQQEKESCMHILAFVICLQTKNQRTKERKMKNERVRKLL
jgi:hypothetical protein